MGDLQLKERVKKMHNLFLLLCMKMGLHDLTRVLLIGEAGQLLMLMSIVLMGT